MFKHIKKLIAPIIISLIALIYFAALAIVCIYDGGCMNLVGLLFFVAIPLAAAGVCIWVLIERIKEVRSGEEDDLSDY